MRITFTIPGSQDHVCLIGRAVKGVLEDVFVDEGALFLMELAVCEAVANSIKHASGRRAGDVVEVDMEINDSEVIVEVKDEGKEFNPGFLDDCRLQQTCDLESIKEGGRGIPIIKQVMDQVEYYSSCGKNILVMKKNLPHREKNIES